MTISVKYHYNDETTSHAYSLNNVSVPEFWERFETYLIASTGFQSPFILGTCIKIDKVHIQPNKEKTT
jgi:hypothetical protein